MTLAVGGTLNPKSISQLYKNQNCQAINVLAHLSRRLVELCLKHIVVDFESKSA